MMKATRLNLQLTDPYGTPLLILDIPLPEYTEIERYRVFTTEPQLVPNGMLSHQLIIRAL